MRKRSANPDGADQGFILIFAIAACLLLAVIGVVVGRSVQSAVRDARMSIDIAKARALADGGIALGLARLQSADGEDPIVCAVEGAGTVAVSMSDEAGKVPLNTGNANVLIALFSGLGQTRDASRDTADQILDYRDADDAARSGGSEREAYAAAGFVFGPKNGDFDSVAELDRVLGLAPELRRMAKPHVTAAVAAAGVDPAAASDALLQLLAGDRAAFGDRPELPAALTARSTRTVYLIRSIGVVEGARYVRETVIARPQRSGERLRHISWMQGELNASDDANLAQAGSAPPC